MNDGFGQNMIDATRLTRAGRLADATAFLQRVLRGAEPNASDTPFDTGDALGSHVIDVAPDKVELTDRRPSPSDTQAFETGVSHGDAGAKAAAWMPDALRGFVKRFNPTGAAPRRSEAAETASAPIVDGGSFVTRTFSNQAGTRAYKLFTPSGYVGQALPLIVMLHGCKQSPDDFAAGTRMNLLAEATTCFVAYPAQAASANVSKCWNWFNPGDQQRDRGEPSLIAGITRQIMRDHAVDPRRVYIAGLSAGGAAATILGSTYPDLYAAIGVHSGLACGAASDLPSALNAMRQGSPQPSDRPRTVSGRVTPTIVFHGDSDSTVNPRNADQLIAQAGGADLQVSVERGHASGGLAYTRACHADPSGQTILEQWVVHGGGHAWSGGSPAGSYTDARGPDATMEMVRFFLAHPHPSAA